MQVRHLQQAEQRFAAGVDAPSSATPAHQTRSAMLQYSRTPVRFNRVPEGAAGALAALTAMKQQPGLPGPGGLNQAMRSASMTMFDVMSSRSDQPTTWRLNRSITTAR